MDRKRPPTFSVDGLTYGMGFSDFTSKLSKLQRIMCVAGGLLLILPGAVTDICGILVAAVALLAGKLFRKKAAE